MTEPKSEEGDGLPPAMPVSKRLWAGVVSWAALKYRCGRKRAQVASDGGLFQGQGLAPKRMKVFEGGGRSSLRQILLWSWT